MCQIIIKPKGILTNIPNLDRAKERNKDGFGVMWFDTDINKLQVFKSLDYEVFKKVIIENVKDFSAVIHLRFASKGEVSLDNVHPFKTSRGALLCHNGTLQSWGNDTTSDTKEFSDTFRSLNIDWESKATETLVGHTIGTAYNKIVVMMPSGHVKIFNENLFVEEEGIKYSNTCHKEPVYYYPTKKHHSYCNREDEEDTYFPLNDTKTQEKFKVFVYGTLKEGKHNHAYLKNAKFLYKAQTVLKFAMVGTGLPFPYVLGEHAEGFNISGEVYEVDEDTKEILDILEGAPHHYIEQEIKVVQVYERENRAYLGVRQDDVLIYTKTTTTKFPSTINRFDKSLFIKEW